MGKGALRRTRNKFTIFSELPGLLLVRNNFMSSEYIQSKSIFLTIENVL
jgi:hypothetical protein